MSFILDALKKSEAERQRQTGPTLLELRVTQPRRRYPIWAMLVAGLLVVNVVVLLVIMLHRPVPIAPIAGSGTVSSTPVSAVAATVTAPQAAVTRALAPALPTVSTAAGGTAVATTPAAPVASSNPANPADYEPAVPAGNAVAPSVEGSGAATHKDYANLPSLSELGGNMPTLQLELLDYSDRPGERYALVNMRRVHEGDVLPDGTRVLAITRAGVAMEYRNQQFMLRPGGTVQSTP